MARATSDAREVVLAKVSGYDEGSTMRAKASTILTAVALAQVLLTGAALGFLVFKLRDIRREVTRIGHETQPFLNQLADIESDLYRTSILLRDYIILNGPEQQLVDTELTGILGRISSYPIKAPQWAPRNLRPQVEAIEEARREYVSSVRTVTAWQEVERRLLGPAYLARQVTPMREKFTKTAREISTVARELQESRNQSMAATLGQIQLAIVRILSAVAIFGLLLAGLAVLRFRRYEVEREVYLNNLERAEDDLRGLSQKLIDSQEQERKRLSRELHDEVGQILTALRVRLGRIESSNSESLEHLIAATELADRSLRSVREMARGLRPAMLDDLGLGPALQWMGRDFAKHNELDVDVKIESEIAGLGDAQRTCLYRVAQEALTNCVKHAKAKSVQIQLQESGSEVVLTVTDDGVGFLPGQSAGIGVIGMRERVDELGGEFAVFTSPGNGTRIRAGLARGRA